jgi:hypothetical protein
MSAPPARERKIALEGRSPKTRVYLGQGAGSKSGESGRDRGAQLRYYPQRCRAGPGDGKPKREMVSCHTE